MCVSKGEADTYAYGVSRGEPPARLVTPGGNPSPARVPDVGSMQHYARRRQWGVQWGVQLGVTWGVLSRAAVRSEPPGPPPPIQSAAGHPREDRPGGVQS
eukprot:9172894-Pyramimonas_sp.AAC.1